MKRWIEVSPYSGIEEDAPANQAGSGNIAGLGVDHPDKFVNRKRGTCLMVALRRMGTPLEKKRKVQVHQKD